ncbi:MAG: TonB-dependent receptor [Hyphomonadaceae bacterium]|nr:TonB-dependent receptor [Hyphomonadaceae bacterium]
MASSESTRSKLLTGTALAVLTFGLSMPATAQTTEAGEAEPTQGEAEPTQEDVVVATGIRRSIADALALKKESTSIVEAISAEDIGKLPDVSIADSLARLPGVTAQRVRGRAQQVSIRGLGPDFSIALLNGREQVSAGNNRGIEFDQFPSELINTGVVYKTPDARLAATGVAGAVDLRTARPLDFSERQINLSGKYVYNDNGELNPDFGADGYRLFGSYIDQNEEGTLGWAIGITHQSNPTQFFSRELKTASNQTGQTDDGVYYPTDNPRSGVVSRDFQRTSVAGSLQFEPDDAFQMTLDGYYSDFQDEGIFRGVETPLASWANVTAADISGDGPFASSATYTNSWSVLRTDTEGNSAEILSLGLNTSFQVNERLGLTLDVSHSSLDKNDIDYESYAGTGGAINGGRDPDLLDTLMFTFPENGEYSITAGQDYTDPGNVFLTDPGGWGQVGYIKQPIIEDDLNQVRAEAEYEINKAFIDSVVVGGLYTGREKSFDSNENFIRATSAFTRASAEAGDNTRQLAIPQAAILGATDTGGIGFPIIAYDPSGFLTDGTYGLDDNNDVEWTVEEDITTLYGMVNIYHEGRVPVRGNVGLQYVDVEQSSTAGASFLEDSYDHFLPSANLSFEVMENSFIRLSAAKSVTRPRMDQLTASANPEINSIRCPSGDDGRTYNGGPNPTVGSTCLTISAGNPLLRPYASDSYDIAFERYFSDAGAVSIAVFHRDISDYVQDTTVIIENAAVASAVLGSDFVSGNPGTEFIQINGPNNVAAAKLTGFEAALRLPFDEYVPRLEGFGANLAYTYTDASLDFEGQDVSIPGYSSDTFSGEVYYERGGFRARVNTRYRSGFLSEIQEFDGGLTGAQALSEAVVDAQVGYEWDSGPLKGFGINFEAYNITDEPYRTENDLDGEGSPGTDTFVSRREDYGTTYNFTVSKKF